MENFDIYKDIADRTQGDIYVGVVGPVRTGKSSFIKRFMDLMVLPNIENAYKKERAKDELPQSGSGKSIHTMEPKFVPNEAVPISLADGLNFKVRMVDCVGYIVKGAYGYEEDSKPKMVTTPWSEKEMPFELAAEIGTKKVINDHSTIGIVVTTDGSIAGITREEYVDAEERVVSELKNINKPFIIVLNTTNVFSPEAVNLKKELEEKYDTPVQLVDVVNMQQEDITNIFNKILKEFPVKEINIDMPEWIEKLEVSHWLKSNFLNIIKDLSKSISKVRDVRNSLEAFETLDFLDSSKVEEMNMGDGTARIVFKPKKSVFYNVLSEACGFEIANESHLLSTIKDFYKAKVEYDKIEKALNDVKESGYGLVAPQLTEMKLEEPEFVKQGGKYVVKLKASAPSLHLIRTNVQTEISPIMGSAKESEEMYQSLQKQFEDDASKIWESNIFGKSLEVLVKEGLQNKLFKMPEDVQFKIQKTLEKMINEGNAGLICIIL
ncbi:stage IV sporulation protein A [Clostridium cellulovorans]|uniref:Stage IV sporulation protein A n=1 Tax=Clostridium cellulovorans (strain ATCC 35296 / DSM 3052 / OCM 3 / 743B) TaxID=573061 RepID=D9SL91_CLOC7|nr:stage IV sporulation protein A [Clostridium cellulovorans]ADL51607.1 stage IV sporulation protein A [Clostridium cellulovorans 743B]